ncbi:MAG: hypothetical protein H3C62_06440 [Gemmatimonadaceae bacterium]|nr:hypothetical protein [Gemmatimonadaceae bacterium]
MRFPGGRIAKAGDGPRETRGVLDVDEAADGTVAVLSALIPRVDRFSPSGATSREIVVPIAYGVEPQLADGQLFALMEGLAQAAGDSTAMYVVRLAGNAFDTVAAFPSVAVRPMASSREMIRPAGLFAAQSVLFVSAAHDVFFSDGRHQELHVRPQGGVGPLTYLLPFTARPVTSADVAEATAVLDRKAASGRLAASWRADVARRAREAASTHPVVLDIVAADDRVVILRVDAQETSGEAWAVLDRRTRTVRHVEGDWTAVAGADGRGRILLCSEDETRCTCGWSAPVLQHCL